MVQMMFVSLMMGWFTGQRSSKAIEEIRHLMENQ